MDMQWCIDTLSTCRIVSDHHGRSARRSRYARKIVGVILSS